MGIDRPWRMRVKRSYNVVAYSEAKHGFPNALRELLVNEKDVEFVAYRIDHPQTGSPKLVIRSGKKKPEKALSEAIKKVRKLVRHRVETNRLVPGAR